MHIHFAYIIITLFGWPAGILLGNILANLAWLPVQWFGLHLKLASHHGALHARLDEVMARLDACPACGHRRSEDDLLSRDEPS